MSDWRRRNSDGPGASPVNGVTQARERALDTILAGALGRAACISSDQANDIKPRAPECRHLYATAETGANDQRPQITLHHHRSPKNERTDHGAMELADMRHRELAQDPVW